MKQGLEGQTRAQRQHDFAGNSISFSAPIITWLICNQDSCSPNCGTEVTTNKNRDNITKNKQNKNPFD
jgi:hypothetical protein